MFKIKANTNELFQLISKVIGATHKADPDQEAAYIFLKASDNNKVLAIATDTENTLASTLYVEKAEEGKIAIFASKLYDILKGVSQTDKYITIKEGDNFVICKTASMSAKIATVRTGKSPWKGLKLQRTRP